MDNDLVERAEDLTGVNEGPLDLANDRVSLLDDWFSRAEDLVGLIQLRLRLDGAEGPARLNEERSRAEDARLAGVF